MTITTAFGTVTDYKTGDPVRPATAAEWRRTADAVASGQYTGAFALDGRAVFVDGGPEAGVSDDDIRELEQEAGSAGDLEMASLCRKALDEDDDEARGECVQVILDTRAEFAADAS